MTNDTKVFDNSELSSLLISDCNIIANNLFNFDNLSECEKKICLLSSIFALKLYVYHEDTIKVFSLEHLNIINKIVNEKNNENHAYRIELYISMYGPSSCVEILDKRIPIKIPTKCHNLFLDIHHIDYASLKKMMLNSSVNDILEDPEELRNPRILELSNLLVDTLKGNKILKKNNRYYKPI